MTNSDFGFWFVTTMMLVFAIVGIVLMWPDFWMTIKNYRKKRAKHRKNVNAF